MINLTCKSEFIELFLRNNTFRIVSILLCYGSKAGLDFILNQCNIEQVCVSQMLILFCYGSKARLDFVLNLEMVDHSNKPSNRIYNTS